MDFTDLPLFSQPSNYKAPHNGTEASIDAANSLSAEDLTKLHRIVLNAAIESMPEGATCEELEAMTGLTHQTCSARTNELAGSKFKPPLLVFDSDPKTGKPKRRENKSGRTARIYFVASSILPTQPEPEYDPEELF